MTQTATADPDLRSRLAAVRLYVVTQATHSPERVLDVVEAACGAGADAVQLRRKGDDGLATLRLAERCREITARTGALLIVNDRIDVAAAAGADGVHLGQDDLPVSVARRLWPGRIVGRSTHSLVQAAAAVHEGADYIGVGPVFATPTKPGRAAVGVELVAAVAAAGLGVPWVAIGGIDEANAVAVVRAGAPALAVVRAVCDAAAPGEAAARLRTAVAAPVAAR